MDGFLGIYTELLQHGGVQRMGRHMILAQQRYARKHGLSCTLWSLNDPVGIHQLEIDGEIIHFEGFGKNRRGLALRALSGASRFRYVYLNHINLAPVGLLLKARRPGLRYMVHIHGIEVWRPLTLGRQFTLRHASLITSTSHFTAQVMNEEQFLRMPTSAVLYPTLDPDFLQSSEKLSASGDIPPAVSQLLRDQTPFVFTVSRLDSTEKYKGVDTAIRAFAAMKDQVPGCRYVIVGSGDDLPRLEAIAHESGAASSILFLGRQPDAVLNTLYQHCAVFMLPSAKEGLGIVFLEAMAKARPCIGGNSGGTPEVVRDGENGYLVPFDSVEKQAQRLQELLSNRTLGDLFGKAGERILHNELTYPHFESRLHELFDLGLLDQTKSLRAPQAYGRKTARPLVPTPPR